MKYNMQDMADLFDKLVSSLKEHGFLNTLKKICNRLIYPLKKIRYRLIRRFKIICNRLIRPLRIYVDASFDRQYGTDTAGFLRLKDLSIESENKKHATHYEPTPVPLGRYLLRELKIDHSQYTFIDYGSGKGRALLLASEYPFKKIVGIEFSPELNKISQTNIQIWKNDRQQCFNIESICIDAAQYEIPDGPVVLFFFFPFQPPVLEKVVDRIKKSLFHSPRPLRILYYGIWDEKTELISSIGLGQEDLNVGRPFGATEKYQAILFYSD